MQALSSAQQVVTGAFNKMTTPKTCKAVVIKEAGAPWKVTEIDVPQPEAGEVLIKVEACGICHSDSALQQGQFGKLGTFPRIPGHEIIGRIVAVGDSVKRWKVGERVGGPWHGGHDSTCGSCQRGLFQICDNGLVNGVNRNGGYAEYTTLRAEATVPIPEDVDAAEYAPLLCAGVTVFNSIRHLNVRMGSVVAVQGLGGLGHLAIQYARKMGFYVVAVSSSASKKDLAMKLGANQYLDTSAVDAPEELQKLGGASLIVVTAPNPKIMGPMVNACAPLGKVLILAPVGEIPVNTVTMVVKGISVHGWPSGHAIDSEDAIAFAKAQDVKVMIEKFKLDNIEEAIEHMNSGKVRFRGVLVF